MTKYMFLEVSSGRECVLSLSGDSTQEWVTLRLRRWELPSPKLKE